MLSDALGQGVQTIQQRICWSLSGNEAFVLLESVLRARVLEEAFGPAEFSRVCRHQHLREEEVLIVRKGGPEETPV
jgi:hypothetical protein